MLKNEETSLIICWILFLIKFYIFYIYFYKHCGQYACAEFDGGK